MTSTAVTSFPKIDYTIKPHPSGVIALSLRDTPALIESMLPVQKLCIDVYKERMSNAAQTLTGLGSYWKGRKPLVLNKACVLACLMPATEYPLKDLEIFELLMGMDDVSLSKRKGLARPIDIVRGVEFPDINAYFEVAPPEYAALLPLKAPFDLEDFGYEVCGALRVPKLSWRTEVSDTKKHELSARLFETKTYLDVARVVKRPEEVADFVSTHIWPKVNAHLGTKAFSFPELVEQLGVMRFGHRPVITDTFSGSGQIPFAAAQLGCDVYANDLNPVACLLTWGAFNVVGGSSQLRKKYEREQQDLIDKVKLEIDALGVETDGQGWRGRNYLYCLEVTCPSSGWKVPVLPSLVVSKDKSARAYLNPDAANKRYSIEIRSGVPAAEMKLAENGTYLRGNVVHIVDGVEHRNSLSSIRGDYSEIVDGKRTNKSRLRMWEKSDVVFRDDDIFNERLYAVLWVRDIGEERPPCEFRSVTEEDLNRERILTTFIRTNLVAWQQKGWIPETRIEPGEKTDEPIRTRGWTHWHHLFNPRQLLVNGLLNQHASPFGKVMCAQLVNVNARLAVWHSAKGQGFGSISQVFYNQALNTIYNYGCRGLVSAADKIQRDIKSFPLPEKGSFRVTNSASSEFSETSDIFITDPPYGNAVKYEEILEFFIGWLRKNQPAEFSDWTWDSRRELAVKGEDHDFRLSMVAAYKRMAECMPDNGLQILMFTHQDGNIWADMANIVWASGLRVTAAWYLVTETDSALREGSYVKGTILLVLRKRLGAKRTNQTDLAYELEDEVAEQIKRLTGMNDAVISDSKRAKDGNLFEDADLQMAGYAAALKVLTKYSIIDGKDMVQEALRPRIAGQETLVEGLIEFAVNTANKALVPHGLPESVWHDLNPSERFYLKMLDMESQGLNSLDNYQNFAKAFSVKDWKPLMESEKANAAALRSAKQFARSEMNTSSELFETPTRAVLYALMDLQAQKDIDLVLKGLEQNLKLNAFYSSRDTLVSLSRFIAKKVETMRPEEAAAARILAGGLENQRM